MHAIFQIWFNKSLKCNLRILKIKFNERKQYKINYFIGSQNSFNRRYSLFLHWPIFWKVFRNMHNLKLLLVMYYFSVHKKIQILMLINIVLQLTISGAFSFLKMMSSVDIFSHVSSLKWIPLHIFSHNLNILIYHHLELPDNERFSNQGSK